MAEPSGAMIRVGVAVAWPELQVIVPLTLAYGATVADALRASGLAERFPELEITADRLGVFGEKRSPGDVLADGDRVEIYRPLRVDPREARRKAAAAKS